MSKEAGDALRILEKMLHSVKGSRGGVGRGGVEDECVNWSGRVMDACGGLESRLPQKFSTFQAAKSGG